MNDLSLALIRKGKGTGVVAGTTSHDLELALARKYGDGESDEPAPTLTAYLTFESGSSFTLASHNGKNEKTWDGTLAYSRDGVNWFIWDGTKPLKSKQGGGNRHYLYLGGYGNTLITGYDYEANFKITGEDNVGCTGDIRALLDYEKAAADEDPVMAEFCFAYLFYRNETFDGGVSLPSMALSPHCYEGMFLRCFSLIHPPALPATTLATSCYASMFEKTGIQSAPVLPATTLATRCYQRMFFECNFLLNPPALPATTLAEGCYWGMFSASGLANPPQLPATSLSKSCYYGMFESCASLDTAPALPATMLADSCYERMFRSCALLTTPPALPLALKQATITFIRCFEQMFAYCSGLTAIPEIPIVTLQSWLFKAMFQYCVQIGLSETQTAEYGNEFRIPSSGTGTDYSSGTATNDMFSDTSGTFVGSPNINTTYYTNATIVPAA